MIRVLICDDQEMVCQGLQAILGTADDVQVVGVVYDGRQAVEAIPAARPDVVLMDLKMPVMNGIEATRRIRQDHPQVRVLVLTTFDADEWVLDAVRAGAAGYLLKDTPRLALLEAIRGTAAGESFVDPGVAGAVLSQAARAQPAPDPSYAARLSEREREVLSLLARGLSNAEIASRLHLSEGTVRNYVSAVLGKLEVSDRTQAAVLALRHGLANLDP
jgi:DNA-binding NarL/FixJ family response regulator